MLTARRRDLFERDPITGASPYLIASRRFCVTGPGTPSDRMERLFERFCATTWDVMGLDLCLRVARVIMGAHGDKIWAESRPRQRCVSSRPALGQGMARLCRPSFASSTMMPLSGTPPVRAQNPADYSIEVVNA